MLGDLLESRVIPEAGRQSRLDKEGAGTLEDVLDLQFNHGVGRADPRSILAMKPTEMLDSIRQFRRAVRIDIADLGPERSVGGK